MKRILFATLSMTCIATAAASAADLPRRPAYKAPMVVVVPSWTGCYIGGNIGAASADAKVTDENTGNSMSSATNSGAIGGAQIGCNYQFDSGLVVGFRNMFDATSLNKSGTFPAGNFAGFTGNTKTQWFHTAVARLGYPVMPSTLAYLVGGAAWAQTKQTITNPAGVQVGEFTNSSKTGFAIGGGFEYMFQPNWSTFLEYNYLGFGTTTDRTTAGIPISRKADLQTVLVGVNYRFR